MNHPLILTFVCSSAGTVAGGIENMALQFAVQMYKRGHEVYFITGSRFGAPIRPEVRQLPIEVITVPFLPLRSKVVRWAAKLFRQPALNLQSLNFCFSLLGTRRALAPVLYSDLVITFLEGEAVLLSRHLKKRNIASVYYMSACVDWRWLKRDESVLRLTHSKWFAEFCQNEQNFRVDGYVNAGVPETLLYPSDGRSAATGLIFVGRLEQNKGVLTALSLFAELEPEFPQLRLTFVGDGPLRRRLENQAYQLGLDVKVHFTGAVSRDQVYDQLRSADLFLFPSEYESFPLAVLEAMAFDLPVVASDHPGIREATGGTAVLLPLAEKQPWLDALRKLINDPNERSRIVQKQRKRVRELSWENAAELFQQYLYLALDKFCAAKRASVSAEVERRAS